MRWLRFYILLILLSGFIKPAFASEDVSTKSLDYKSGVVEIGKTYISPFLERDRLNIVSIGDWMAHGIWWGMYDRFKKDRSVNYTRYSNYASGFVRLKKYDWNARLNYLLAKKRVDIAVISFGMNDGQKMNLRHGVVPFNSPEWRKTYINRVDQFVVSLKQHGAAIYWVGLPIVKNAAQAERIKILNGIYKQIARKNEIKFIGSWYDFADKHGNFTFAGLDVNDVPRVLRTQNGVHFTMPGYKKLGKLVDKILSADLSAMDAASKTTLKGSREKEIASLTPGSRDAGSSTPEYKSELDNSGSDISFINKGPLITGSVRRSQSVIDKLSLVPGKFSDKMTPAIIKDRPNLSVKIVSPEIKKIDNSLASPEVAILFEGGYLPPKPGRDDDYSWPR